ncbi:MAG: hypothetical protein PHO15_08720 [Eubacteriales bacterium]|nr:hypothetical protein [Eubacteriales bacterium]
METTDSTQDSSGKEAGYSKIPKSSMGLVVLICTIMLIAGIVGGGIYAHQYMQAYYDMDKSIAGILLSDRLGNDDLAYAVDLVNNDTLSYEITFDHLPENASIRFDDNIIDKKDDNLFMIDYSDLFNYIENNYDVVTASNAYLSFEYTAYIDNEALRHGTVDFIFPLEISGGYVLPEVMESIASEHRISEIAFPDLPSSLTVDFGDSGVQDTGGNNFTFNQDEYLLAHGPASQDTITVELNYSILLKDSVLYEGVLSLEIESIPYYDENNMAPEINIEGLGDTYVFTFDVPEGFEVSIDNAAFNRVADNQFILEKQTAIEICSPDTDNSETPEILPALYTVTYTYGQKELFSEIYTLDIDLRTPLVLDAYNPECRASSITISGLVSSGTTLKLDGKTLELTDNGDGTMSFAKVITLKEGKTYEMVLTATREGELKNTQTIIIKALPAIEYALGASLEADEVVISFETDPDYSISMTVNYYDPEWSTGWGDAYQILDTDASGPIVTGADGTASVAVDFTEGYGVYVFYIMCLDENDHVLYYESKEVYHETADMKTAREYKESCDYININTFAANPSDYMNRKICLIGELYGFLEDRWFILYGYYGDYIVIDAQSDEVIDFLRNAIGSTIAVYGTADSSPEYSEDYAEFNVQYADYES